MDRLLQKAPGPAAALAALLALLQGTMPRHCELGESALVSVALNILNLQDFILDSSKYLKGHARSFVIEKAFCANFQLAVSLASLLSREMGQSSLVEFARTGA